MMASKEKSSQLIDIYNTRAIASKKVGDYDKALESCDIAIRINPKDLTASNFKSFILKEKTDFEKAIEYSDGTFRIKPSYQMSNFDYFLKLPYLSKVSTIDLSNNQIDDKGAKVLADSLAKGEMPKLKVLHLEGNNITDEGETALIKAMKGKVQDIIVITQRVNVTDKMISGTKEEQIAICKELIKKGKVKGTYDEALVIDKSLWGGIKNAGNLVKVTTHAGIGFTKCYFAPEDMAVDYAQNKITAKLPKMLNGAVSYASKLVNLENIFNCYLDASEDAWTSIAGQQFIKHDLCVVGETEFCGE
jgi:tetratricopeptide (TPR) repeat protein